MKINITFEVDERDRLLYGARITGQLVPANHKQIRELIEYDVNHGLDERRAIFNAHTEQVLKLLNEERNPDTVTAK